MRCWFDIYIQSETSHLYIVKPLIVNTRRCEHYLPVPFVLFILWKDLWDVTTPPPPPPPALMWTRLPWSPRFHCILEKQNIWNLNFTHLQQPFLYIVILPRNWRALGTSLWWCERWSVRELTSCHWILCLGAGREYNDYIIIITNMGCYSI